MSAITVQLRGLSGELSLELPEGATIGDVRSEAGLSPDVSLRADGQAASDDTPVRDEQVIVSTAPAAKHG
jgi:hypothetical protein